MAQNDNVNGNGNQNNRRGNGNGHGSTTTTGATKVNFGMYREGLNKGVDYGAVTQFPTGVVIDVPSNGITPGEYAKASAKLGNLALAWKLAGEEADVRGLRAEAHRKGNFAIKAEIDASSSVQQIKIAQLGYQGLLFDVQNAEAQLGIKAINAEASLFQLEVKRAELPVIKAKAITDLHRVQVEFLTSVGELQKARFDQNIQLEVLEIQGYPVGTIPKADLSDIPMPNFTMPQLEPTKSASSSTNSR